MNVELLDKAVASALCPMFQALVPATNTITVVGLASSVVNPFGIKIAMTAAAISQLSMLGASATCPEVEIGPEPPDLRDGCWEVDTAARCWIKRREYPDVKFLGYDGDVKKIISVVPTTTSSLATLELTDGQIVTADSGAWSYADASWYLEPLPGSTCISDGPERPPENPPVPPVTYIDQSTNCSYLVQFLGFIQQTQGGSIQPVFQIESSTPERAGGGRMGGCNLGPVIYSPGPNGPGGPGGPPIPPVPVPSPLPGPGPDGVPWWAAPLLAGATSAALNLIGQGFQQMFEEKLPEGSFTLQAPCDVDEQGNPLVQAWEYPEQTWKERSLAHEITMLEALQTHLNWKTPTCGSTNEKTPLEGQWVTTRWESVEKMAHSGRRLRKLFRYRTKSSRDVGQLSAYWEAFTWQAGDVCVRHTGAWWGDPQVWAASQEEGQRVIRFAAAEAGIDPDQDGQWRTSSSRSPRYGMSGTMKVARFEGFPWVASRDGAEWPNILAKSSDP